MFSFFMDSHQSYMTKLEGVLGITGLTASSSGWETLGFGRYSDLWKISRLNGLSSSVSDLILLVRSFTYYFIPTL